MQTQNIWCRNVHRCRVGGGVILLPKKLDQVAQIKGIHECYEKNRTHEHEPLDANFVTADKHHSQKQCAESNRSDFRVGRNKVSKGEAEKQSKTSGAQIRWPQQAGKKREN